MPKLNNTHLPERIQEHIAKMERGEEVEAKKDKTLLNEQQQKELKEALAHQQKLKKTHKRPKTQEEKDAIGWKEIRDVRLGIYKQALEELSINVVDDIKELQRQREAKAARVFMDAWSKAGKEGKVGNSAISAGNIALTRAGFTPQGSIGLSKRDREIRAFEEEFLKQSENELSEEEKEQLDLIREHEKAVKKRKK
ncbi:hypothetical protein [Polynucleobacter paneuropaeus]|uniref:hypothetical protein n=1 Tax=Polynucleobacter paneuropaeus TaxID=2527775 RepID=UPI001BFD2B5B|nr:hypothetical protein [Polynucleobacter paneuropaeus]MBT8635511.1 hypothetical protein [Polynucleobacter paneuropaeus]QWD52162.1 hypothetical protein C2753_06515 [Polynucleobacter paneuropaeus]QWD55479.1 hypothetical protein C2750_07045 [Polynucleobacter paneuropaeus]QWD57081.1 hypothetical protein C2754_06510 [Polynucleobacter paneuropaeus]